MNINDGVHTAPNKVNVLNVRMQSDGRKPVLLADMSRCDDLLATCHVISQGNAN